MLTKFYQWLHGKWPAGLVEKMPIVGESGKTNVSGIRVVGDLSGVPLLKFSSQTGVDAINAILAESDFLKKQQSKAADTYDVAIIGAGVSGISAAMQAKQAGLNYCLLEASQALTTIINFPKQKPIFTYPTDMIPSGGVQYSEKSDIKESLLDDIHEQIQSAGLEITTNRVANITGKVNNFTLELEDQSSIKTLQVIIAIGRSGNYRRLNVNGEELDKVSNRLHDPKEFKEKEVLIVGGGDSAAEAAIALAESGAHVSLSCRSPEITRPKPENTQNLMSLANQGKIKLYLGSKVKEISSDQVHLTTKSNESKTIKNDAVFILIGREAPLDFFRRCGVAIQGERNLKFWLTMVISLAIATFIYQWKKSGTWLPIAEWSQQKGVFPYGLEKIWASWGGNFENPEHILGTMKFVVGDPGFWYSLLYCIFIVVFGIRRIQRRQTPYVKRQTLTLAAFQLIPLFLLPYIILPWAGFNGAFDSGIAKYLADELFPIANYGSGREYWRAFGLILAWPLFFWNVFTSEPMWWWLGISLFQTFVIIPFIVMRWGKGAYCGWICSCGALAETLGDTQRHKMPHGPFWNKMNMVGQVFLALSFILLILKILAWAHIPFAKDLFNGIFYGGDTAMAWSYVWFVDLLWAGILGVGLYFHFSGRVWCRFACPLASLMHIYSRFGKFAIFADKKKCISCNVCTSVCHQGIDIMNFANKGLPMEDPQCVRCSACVQQCPTGVLSFGRYDMSEKTANKKNLDRSIIFDSLPASLTQMTETTRPTQ